MPPLRIAGPATFAVASKRYRTSTILDCTPDELFDILEDADAWPDFVSVIEKVEWTSPMPPKVGTTRTVTMKGGVTVEERFTAYERGSHMQFVFTSMSQPGLDAFGEDYRVADLGDGRCRLDWTIVMEPVGVAKFVTRFTGWTTHLVLPRMAKGLRDYVAGR